jgi:hypothetical protein
MTIFHGYGELGPPGPKGRQPLTEMSASADHDYEMSISIRNLEGMSLEDSAAAIAHEAMHVLAMNNRAWHNEMASRGKRGCATSLFTDRIYFTEAVCFPSSTYGSLFFSPDGGSRCDGVCEQALTTVDAEVERTLHPTNRYGDRGGIYGPSLIARPYSAHDTARICSIVRAAPLAAR